MTGLTHQQRRDKAENTKAVALGIIGQQKAASDSKVAKLKAMRLANSVQTPSAEPSPERKPSAASG